MSDGSAWLICVVDETDDERCLHDFPWGGSPYALAEGMAFALVERRLQRLLDGYLAGERRVTEKLHYGEAIAPRLRESDGVWLDSPPNVG